MIERTRMGLKVLGGDLKALESKTHSVKTLLLRLEEWLVAAKLGKEYIIVVYEVE